MKKLCIALTVLTVITLFSCSSKKTYNFNLEKKYWTVEDYESAISEINYNMPKEEGYPRLSDPNTAAIFNKLVDLENVNVILLDTNLGLKYRQEVSKKFFDISEQIQDIYSDLDEKDHYIYPMEFVKTIEFSLNTQLLYFKIGNNRILRDATNPNEADLKNIITTNEQTIVNNFIIQLELLAKEEAFTPESIVELSSYIDKYFSQLILNFSHSDYSEMKQTATSLSSKVKSTELKSSLTKLLLNIEKLNTTRK